MDWRPGGPSWGEIGPRMYSIVCERCGIRFESLEEFTEHLKLHLSEGKAIKVKFEDL